jgi:hypothetical protein
MAPVRHAERQGSFAVAVERVGARQTMDVSAKIFASEAVAGGRLERVSR